MKHKKLGGTGLEVSELCLGCMTYGTSSWRPWVLDAAESSDLITEAYEAGINFFDTADAYSSGESEAVLGATLEKIGQRDEMVIATKVGLPLGTAPNQAGLSKKRILRGLENSLRRLRTDYVDIFQLHRLDAHTPLETVVEAMDEAVRSGKALYAGGSSMHSWQLATMLGISNRQNRTRFSTMQIQVNLIYREEEREMLPLCQAEGLGVISWSPLARGFLAGNRSAGAVGTVRSGSDPLANKMYFHDNDFEILEKVFEVAGRHGVDAAQIALAWVCQHPQVTVPIIGVSSGKQLTAALSAKDLMLDEDDLRLLEEAYRPHAVEWGV